MTEERFVALRNPRWTDFERSLAERPQKRLRRRVEEAINFPVAYRGICRDLNQARAERYSVDLIERLNRLVWSGHHLLYGSRAGSPWRAIGFFAVEFPRSVRRYARALLLCHLLFYGVVGLTFLYAAGSEERATLFLGTKQANALLEMYDPSNSGFLRPGGITSDADMFGYYIDNNVSLGFKTFAGGALAGLGSLFILVTNAVNLGAAMALVGAAGYGSTFFPYVVGHAAFELTAIIIFALSGFLLGRALVMPGRLSRSEALRRIGREVFPLIAGAAVFLFIAACIEAFWSARVMDSWIKFGVAAILWLSVFLFFLLGGRGEPR